MKITILNGSPKGNYSVTLQTLLYLQNQYPEHEYEIVQVGSRIKAFEKNMTEVLTIIEKSDLLLFAYPVYTFIAPYQLHRFIELLKESDIDLNGKFASQITTSKHFYDITAHNYIRDNAFDMGLKYVKGLSADMEDLLVEKGRVEAKKYFDYLIFSIEHDIYETPKKMELKTVRKCYEKSIQKSLITEDKKVIILTNCEEKDYNLQNMIEDLAKALPYEPEVVNVREYPFMGGCLGCFGCAINGSCIYKDGFDQYLRDHIQTADGIIYAFTIKDHSMGASFKIYDDRQFCNGHRTLTVGMPIGYLVSGDYSQESNLQMIVEGRCEVGHSYLTGVATDEGDTKAEIDKLATKFQYAIEHKLMLSQNFYGIGGMKIFRDLIYTMQGIMKEDHRFYKNNKLYDFPQKQRLKVWKMKLIGGLLGMPSVKKKMGNKMNEGILLPYKKIIWPKISNT